MKKKIAIIIPNDCELVVLKPGQATLGSRFAMAILVGEPADAVNPGIEGKFLDGVQDWFDTAFLTRLAVSAKIERLKRP